MEITRDGASSAMYCMEITRDGAASAMYCMEITRDGASSAMYCMEITRDGASSAMYRMEITRDGAPSPSADALSSSADTVENEDHAPIRPVSDGSVAISTTSTVAADSFCRSLARFCP